MPGSKKDRFAVSPPEGREARGGERAAAGQGVGAQRHAGALSKVFCEPSARQRQSTAPAAAVSQEG